MSRKVTLISLIVLTVFASLLAAQSSNMFFSDVLNAKALFSSYPTIISTMPALMLSVITVIVFLGLIRSYIRPNSKKKLLKNYTIISLVVSGIGFVTSILTGVVVYKSFVKPYPFPGYTIIFMVIHLLIIASCVYALVSCFKKMPEDTEEFKVDFKHVLKTIGWFLFISMTFNRFGMFLAMPAYVYLRNLYYTFFFYLYLLMPVAIGTYKVLLLLGYIEKLKTKKIFSIVLLACNICLFIPIIIVGAVHSDAVSAVSAAMPLERLSSMPIEILIHFFTYLGVILPLFIQVVKQKEE